MPDFRQLELLTPRLHLRPLVATDRDALFAIESDPEQARYGSRPPWTELSQADRKIAEDTADLESGKHVGLGIVRREDGRLLGTCCLFNLHADSRRAELGYGLAPAHWGQGLAREAVGALLE